MDPKPGPGKPSSEPLPSFIQAVRPRTVIVVGAGVVGLAAAWLLSHRGHRVTVLNPTLAVPKTKQGRLSGSQAALGVLMADVFHRSRGRAWALRQRSRELWELWQQLLSSRGLPLVRRPGLLLLAKDQDQWQRHQALVLERTALGIPLELWPAERLQDLRPSLPCGCCGALFSPRDGQLDGAVALQQWLIDGRRLGMEEVAGSARRLERSAGGWRLHLDRGVSLQAEAIVLAAGLELGALWPDGAELPPAPALGAVLGQALELQLDDQDPDPTLWPGSLVWSGINLVPRPGHRLWLGATLEPGDQAGTAALEQLRTLEGMAPAWLERATVLSRWEGLRVRPEGQPAPLLLQPAPGLVVAGGAYRNGVLLAPALAEAVVECLERR